METSSFRKLLPLLLTSLIWFGIGWYVNTFVHVRNAQGSLSPAQARIVKAQTLLLNHQLRSNTMPTGTVVADLLGEAAIDGMLAWSKDTHADLYGPAAAARYAMDVKGLTGVPGYWFGIVDGQMVVTDVPLGTPAAEVGLQVGDILLSADGVTFDETNAGNEASFLQRGPIGSILDLRVQRGQETLAFRIPRQKQQFISSRVLADQIGYLDLDLFVQDIETTVKGEIESLLDQGIKGLIWDLRRNDGGYVDTMRHVLSYFIPEGVLYIVEFNDGTQKSFEVTGEAFVPKLPIVILVDRFTNSSAEIATDAMIEYRQATVVGQRTAGKGTVQDTVWLDDNYMLHYTIAQWLTPAHQSIEGKGITPTVQVENDPATVADEVLEAALTLMPNLQPQ